MATPTYPSWNDKEYDLLKKMTSNTALIADYEIGDVASVAGTAGNVLVNGGTAAATGSITLSLPTALTSVNSVTAATTTNLTLSGGSSGASLVLGQGANGAATITPKGTGKLIVTGTAPKLSIENGAFSDGSTIFASNNGDATLTLQNAAVATKAIFGTSSSGTTVILGSTYSVPFYFYTNNTNVLRLKSDGSGIDVLGTGTSSVAGKLTQSPTLNANGDNGVFWSPTITPLSGNIYINRSYATINSGASAGGFITEFTAGSVNSGTSNIASIEGFTAGGGNSGASGTMTSYTGFRSAPVNTGTGSVSNVYGFRAQNVYNPSGYVGNQYGVYVDSLTGAANNYAFYSAGAGIVRIGDTTPSINTASGALVVSGGVGVVGNMFAGNLYTTGAANVLNANSTGSTDLLINPTTKTSGNLIDAQVGGASKFKVTSTGAGTFTGDVTISNASNTAGSLYLNGTTGAGQIWVNNYQIMRFYDTSYGTQPLYLATNGGLNISSTTASTSTSTGALVVGNGTSGGLGVGGAAWFGGVVTVPDGNQAAPGLRITSRSDTGLAYTNTNEISIVVAGEPFRFGTGLLVLGQWGGVGATKTIKGPSGGPGVSNRSGNNLIIGSGESTGNGSASSIILKTGSTGASGTQENALVTALTLDGSQNATFAGTVTDSIGNVRSIPQNAQTSAYILAATDNGKHVSITTGGITVNSGIFSAGQVVTIYNNSSSNQTITQGASVTMYQAGTTNTGNRTLASYGVATVLCVASNTFVITGTGLS